MKALALSPVECQVYRTRKETPKESLAPGGRTPSWLPPPRHPEPLPRGNVRKAVIPAAGLGTRFLPAAKAVPKEMLPLVDKPVIQYIVEEAVHNGITDILLDHGPGQRQS